MEELRKKAINYAEENYNEVMKEAFAKVYADGYRNGYKECKEERAINLCDGKTEYVDLGLPSGTLWSSDYERVDDSLLFLPYIEAEHLCIPTKEQWEELATCCKWEFFRNHDYSFNRAVCIGPNGKTIIFNVTSMFRCEGKVAHAGDACFWIKDTEGLEEKPCITLYEKKNIIQIDNTFPGYRLPLRLVK